MHERVGRSLLGGLERVLQGPPKLTLPRVGARNVQVGIRVGGVQRVGIQKGLHGLTGVPQHAVNHAHHQVQVGDVRIDGQRGFVFGQGLFVVAGGVEHIAAGPPRFQQAGVQGHGLARGRRGLVIQTLVREDLGLQRPGQRVVGVQFQRALEGGQPFQGVAHLMQQPPPQGMGLRVVGVEQQRVLGRGQRGLVLPGQGLQTGQFEVPGCVVGLQHQGPLISLDRGLQFALREQIPSLLHQRLGIGRGGGRRSQGQCDVGQQEILDVRHHRDERDQQQNAVQAAAALRGFAQGPACATQFHDSSHQAKTRRRPPPAASQHASTIPETLARA